MSVDQQQTQILSASHDKRYPRSGSLRVLRALFLGCWGIILFYLGNAAWNLYQLLVRTDPSRLTYKMVLAALVLPGPLGNADNTSLLVLLSFAIPFWPILLGCLWATRDLQLELKEPHNGQVYPPPGKVGPESLPNSGILTPVSRPQGPPNDLARLSHQEPLVGRAADAQWLFERLRAGRAAGITTALHGMGGIGKTALAADVIRRLHTQGRFRGGIAVVRCQDMTDAVKVLQGVLARFDPQRRQPDASDLDGLGEAVLRMLDGRDALVILDNVEPELDIIEIVRLLRAARGITLLLTARHVLPQAAVPVGASKKLEPLPPHDALELFARTLGRSRPALKPNERSAAESIVDTLQGHPLAIKIVGAYAANSRRDLKVLASEIKNLLKVIELPDDDKTPRAVAVAFTKSTKALPTRDQEFFKALAAFATAEFGRQAAIALGRELGLPRPEDHVDLLVQRALVEAYTNEAMPEEGDGERLRLHTLLRAFASDAFTRWTPKKRDAARYAVAKYYAEYANRVKDAGSALSHDELNIVGTLKWAYSQKQDELVMELCLSMQHFWADRWRVVACLEYLPWGVEAAQHVAQQTNEREDRLRAATLSLTHGQALQHVGKVNDAEQVYQENLTIRQAEQDREGEGRVLAYLGQIAQQRGQLDEAERYYNKSLSIMRAIPNQRREGILLGYLGDLASQLGRLEAAESYYKQGLDLLVKVQDRRSESHHRICLGEIAQARGNWSEAEIYYQYALAITREDEVQNRQGEGWVHRCIGSLDYARGQLDKAEEEYWRALEIAHEVQDRRGEGLVLGKFGELAHIHRSPHEAQEYYQQALDILSEVQDKRGECQVLRNLGSLFQAYGQPAEAEDYYRKALVIARDMKYALNHADLALTLGTFLCEQRGNPNNEGCLLLAEAVQSYAALGLPVVEEARRALKRFKCS